MADLKTRVSAIVNETPIFDIHTHLYAPHFGEILLWGLDELLVYHYLVAEVFRYLPELSYDDWWRLSKTQQADLIWEKLFIEHSPVSEACRGILTTLNRMGLDVKPRDLPALRRHFAGKKLDDHLSECMALAGVRKMCMTNNPFDDEERPGWETYAGDDRFAAALRIDPLLLDWARSHKKLRAWGYGVSEDFSGETLTEVRRFLSEWAEKMDALYVMVSLPPDLAFPDSTPLGRLIEGAILPFCAESGLPLALMLGVKKLIQPGLQIAGDGVGRSDLSVLETLCRDFPGNKLLVTVLSRENQHELNVLARKFRNLHPFGCWWFTNVPSIVEEMTRMRLELIGASVTLQHSDARVLDQIVYKWDHSRQIIAKVLAEKYADLEATGWRVADHVIRRDAHDLLGGSFEAFLRR